MANQEKLLIGSCGGLTGVYLAQQFRRFPELELWGMDVNEENACKFFVDHLVVLPKAGTPEFMSKLVGLLTSENITYYLPTHSNEILFISKHEKELREHCDTRFLVSPYETYCLLNNKDDANRMMCAWGIPVPYMYKAGDIPRFPVFMKRTKGSGSVGTFIVETPRLYQVMRDEIKDAAFYEFVEGNEYTVDCMFDAKGQLLAYNQRRRVKTIGGAVSITKNENEIDIEPWLEIFCKYCRFCGCVNFQYILRNGVPYFIDINLRYPSGGLPLSVASGVDVPEMMLRLLRGEKIERNRYHSDHNHRVMYRYYKEIFEEK